MQRASGEDSEARSSWREALSSLRRYLFERVEVSEDDKIAPPCIGGLPYSPAQIREDREKREAKP